MLCQDHNGKVTYGIEASIECGGFTLNWLKSNLQLFQSYSTLEECLLNGEEEFPTTNDGVYFVPCFSGLLAPFWNSNSKSLLYGLSGVSERRHIIRAVFEALAYRVKDCLELLVNQIDIERIVIDGGLTQSPFLCSFLNQLLGVKHMGIFWFLKF